MSRSSAVPSKSLQRIRRGFLFTNLRFLSFFCGSVFKRPTTGNLIEPAAAFMPQATTSAQNDKDGGQPTGPDTGLSFKDIQPKKKKTTQHFHTESSPQKLRAKVVLKSAVSHFCLTITDGFSKQNVLSWSHLNDTEIIIEVGLIGIH